LSLAFDQNKPVIRSVISTMDCITYKTTNSMWFTKVIIRNIIMRNRERDRQTDRHRGERVRRAERPISDHWSLYN